MAPVPVVFINCRQAPFLDDIEAFQKTAETRSRNTLGCLVGQRVILAETGRKTPRLARCSVIIDSVQAVRSREAWEALRPVHRVPAGSKYDWHPWTKVKYLYHLSGLYVFPRPFSVPEGVRHGRTWMEYPLADEIDSFVAMLLMTDQETMPIFAADAAYTMHEWDLEGVEYPDGMTPDMFADAWNKICEEESRDE